MLLFVVAGGGQEFKFGGHSPPDADPGYMLKISFRVPEKGYAKIQELLACVMHYMCKQLQTKSD